MTRLISPPSSTFMTVVLASISASIIAMTACGVVRFVVADKGQHIRQTGSGPVYEAHRQTIREVVRLQKEGYAAWHEEDDLPKAEKLFKQALALAPEEPRELYALAQILDAQGKNVEASEVYRKVVHPRQGTGSTFQTNPAILLRYATLCKSAGKTEEANFAYQQIVKNARSQRIDTIGDSYPSINDGPAKNDNMRIPNAEALAHVVAGIQTVKQGKNEKAAKEFNTAVELQPDLAIGHFYRGFVLQNIGKMDEAQIAFEKASKLGPVQSSARVPQPGGI
jgi:tetratricopeptide (TPR) repeat protein